MGILKAGLIAGLVLAMAGCVSNPHQRSKSYDPAYPVAAQPPQDNSGSIYKAGYGVSLFEDTKALRVGDLLTIQLIENTSAQKQASTSTSKETNIDFPVPSVFGQTRDILTADVGTANDFAGDGQSSQSNSLSGSITVFVAQVLPNGNLVVRGEKRLTLNQGEEFIRVTGIVRPTDVSPDNTIPSTKVANAEIIYSGEGDINNSNKKGWLARFFNGPWWPF